MPKIYSLISKLFFPIILSLSLAHDILALTITLLVCLLWAAAFFLSEPEIKYKYFPPERNLQFYGELFLFWCTLSVKHTNKKIQLLIQECIYLLPASIYLPPTRTQLKKSKHQQAQAGIQFHTTTYLNTNTQK